MDYKDLLYFFISTIVASLIFMLLFEGLNKSMLKPFDPIQRVTCKLKRKKLYRGIAAAVLILIGVYVKDFFQLSYVGFGIIVSFFTCLNNIVFENPA